MNKRTLYKLEFHKIKEMLKAHAVTQIAKDQVDLIEPSSNFEEIVCWQKETTDALNMAVKKGRLPMSSIKDIRAAVKRVERGAILSGGEILNIGNVIRTARLIKRYYKEEETDLTYPALDAYFTSLFIYPELEHRINQCIIGEDEFADDATPGLSQVRKQIKSANNKIRETLHGIIHGNRYQDMLQEPVVTQRQDRYCVPIKVEYRSSFKGIVHDQSATGATVFIEPEAIVDLNNQVRMLRSKEQEEIEKILIELTDRIAEVTSLVLVSFDMLIKLDVIFARAEFALKIDGREPKLNTKGYINLKRARHPLLTKQTVVPIDVYVGGDFSTLLITGPNTGGKTVTLKTIGLFTLMAQSGMQIPAAEDSEIAVFDDVFSDLGDEQSIEQNLSTFSSHMTNLVSIINEMSLNSLVLLDEVGSGTDPIEGAALAMSILEHLRKQQIRTVATTHYSELKLYALSTQGVENASCEFDVESLRPTYKLLIGVPGKSNAFAISMKLGLPEYLIEDAKVFLLKENVKMEDILVELETSKKSAEIEKEKAKAFRDEAERLKEEIKKERQKLEKTKQKVMERAQQKANEMLKKVEEETDAALKEVRQAARKAQVVIDERELQGAKETVKKTVSKQESIVNKAIGAKTTYKKVPKNIKKGEMVMVSTLMQQGTVIQEPDQTGNVMVRVGILPIKIHISNLQRVQVEETVSKAKSKLPRSGGISHNISKSMNIRPEVDVRGMMSDEAVSAVDKYLDDAYLAGLKQATIIHGKGTGALRAAITTMLKRHPHIQSQRPGKYGEGEAGVTVVEIK